MLVGMEGDQTHTHSLSRSLTQPPHSHTHTHAGRGDFKVKVWICNLKQSGGQEGSRDKRTKGERERETNRESVYRKAKRENPTTVLGKGSHLRPWYKLHAYTL